MAARLRWPAFSLSLILHIGAVALLTWIDIAFAPSAAPHYEVLVVPDHTPSDSKIVWYNFRKEVPDVAPDAPFGPLKTAHGELDPNQTLVTHSKAPHSARQVIRQPDHPKLLPKDVPAPNLVAIAVKPIPATETLGAMVSRQKLPPKRFVPPVVRNPPVKAARRVAVPALVDAGVNPVPALQAVMISLNPAATLPPPGSRAAQIARAPEAGAPSSGAVPSSATIVPGLLSHGKPGESPGPVPAVPAPVSPAPAPSIPGRLTNREIVLPNFSRTVSAPLRPSSRVIPASVEARFSDRDVYAMVIEGPAVPGYEGDWVMWFAERNPPQGSAGLHILAPVPARKDSLAAGDPVSGTFQFGACIDTTGRISAATVLRGAADPALRHRALEELGSWEFKPALHNGQPTVVDVVIEIPFRAQSAPQPLR